MKLIVGLGNPGKGYAPSRHNVGARAVQHMSKRLAAPLKRLGALASVAEATVGETHLFLAVPRTYMNESGRALTSLVRRLHIPSPREVLVIYDDMDLPLGKIRVRPRGSPGGHRGLSSVIEALGTEELPRLRIGIGRPPPGVDEVTYVLGGFTPPEEDLLVQVLDKVYEAIVTIQEKGLGQAMNLYN
ncbi:MAG: aminoacyl-tRNA hydrolase [Chloroflexi bacterium]|nr:aminoacyl-tRNA hydrolase [Chloroflexota bacterium]